MTETGASSSRAAIAALRPDDIGAALRAGWRDFRRAPLLGLVFGGVYVAIGLLIVLVTLASGHTFYAVFITLGFPLVAPFAAVGLYETSRRLERGLPHRPREIFGVVWAERGRQLPWFEAVMAAWFPFYLFLSHTLFALVLGLGALSRPLDLALLISAQGMAIMGVQLTVGGLFAWTVFAACAVSLPMMMDREVDFVTAMLTSFRAVGQNLGPMILWAVTVVAIPAAAMLPFFLGLFVALPILGHATWHLYRRVIDAGG